MTALAAAIWCPATPGWGMEGMAHSLLSIASNQEADKWVEVVVHPTAMEKSEDVAKGGPVAAVVVSVLAAQAGWLVVVSVTWIVGP